MDFTHATDADILAIANPIMDNLMDASTAIDHARHVSDFTDRAKAMLPPSTFEAVCRKYQGARGFFASREPVALFRRPDAVAVIWRQTFTQAPGEYVAELLLVQQGGRYLVDHVMVF